jgi:hypothetical protein
MSARDTFVRVDSKTAGHTNGNVAKRLSITTRTAGNMAAVSVGRLKQPKDVAAVVNVATTCTTSAANNRQSLRHTTRVNPPA